MSSIILLITNCKEKNIWILTWKIWYSMFLCSLSALYLNIFQLMLFEIGLRWLGKSKIFPLHLCVCLLCLVGTLSVDKPGLRIQRNKTMANILCGSIWGSFQLKISREMDFIYLVCNLLKLFKYHPISIFSKQKSMHIMFSQYKLLRSSMFEHKGLVHNYLSYSKICIS